MVAITACYSVGADKSLVSRRKAASVAFDKADEGK